MCAKGLGGMAGAGIGDPDPCGRSSLGKTYGFGKIAVIADYHRAFIGVAPSVVEEMDGEIDVGALLFGLQYLDGTAPWPWVGERRADTMGLKVIVMEGDGGVGGGERTQVRILALGLGGVAGIVADAGGEVLKWQ